MMDFATNAIDDATQKIPLVVRALRERVDIFDFHEPLRTALKAAYLQPNLFSMMPLRLALARLITATLEHLQQNPVFETPFRDYWDPYMLQSLYVDLKTFRDWGWLERTFKSCECYTQPRGA